MDQVIDPQLIETASALLKSGGLVAFPTETVYGLGADATNAEACGKIFAAKGRPSTNPLIVHVWHEDVARRYVTDFPLVAQRLAEEFWPGPLTLVLPRLSNAGTSGGICDAVTAGNDTVALRIPSHPLAMALLKAFDGPVAAPSANRSTRVSPTSAQHVIDELGDKVDLILDGGSCPVGIESTVLDLTTFPRPTLLRPGAISREQIEAVIGTIEVSTGRVFESHVSAPSPGLSALHYAPATPAYRFNKDQFSAVAAKLNNGMGASALLMLSPADVPEHHDIWEMPHSPDHYARKLYATLRSADDGAYEAIFVEMPPEAPNWVAVRDRLIRAARPL